jgi:quercetin dioxygenase-like cupin family protein
MSSATSMLGSSFALVDVAAAPPTVRFTGVANIFQPEEWVERAKAPLIGRTARVGAQAGAERLGATLYEIDPGNNGSPFHLHHGYEEMIIVVAGRPTLADTRRTPPTRARRRRRLPGRRARRAPAAEHH